MFDLLHPGAFQRALKALQVLLCKATAEFRGFSAVRREQIVTTEVFVFGLTPPIAVFRFEISSKWQQKLRVRRLVHVGISRGNQQIPTGYSCCYVKVPYVALG